MKLEEIRIFIVKFELENLGLTKKLFFQVANSLPAALKIKAPENKNRRHVASPADNK